MVDFTNIVYGNLEEEETRPLEGKVQNERMGEVYLSLPMF